MSVNKGLFSIRKVPLAIWNHLWRIGEARSRQKLQYESSEYLDPNSHELGVIGEWTFGRLVGLPAAEDINPLGDPGFDFPGVDVKAAKIFQYPWLKVREEKIVDGIVFALVAIDVRQHVVRYCGYADAALLRKYKAERLLLNEKFRTERTGRKRDEQLGPLSRIIRAERQLIKALPPPYEFKLRTIGDLKGGGKAG